jgi:hypothetical protein
MHALDSSPRISQILIRISDKQLLGIRLVISFAMLNQPDNIRFNLYSDASWAFYPILYNHSAIRARKLGEARRVVSRTHSFPINSNMSNSRLWFVLYHR